MRAPGPRRLPRLRGQQFRKLVSRGDGSFSADTRKRTAKHARHLARLCTRGGPSTRAAGCGSGWRTGRWFLTSRSRSPTVTWRGAGPAGRGRRHFTGIRTPLPGPPGRGHHRTWLIASAPPTSPVGSGVQEGGDPAAQVGPLGPHDAGPVVDVQLGVREGLGELLGDGDRVQLVAPLADDEALRGDLASRRGRRRRPGRAGCRGRRRARRASAGRAAGAGTPRPAGSCGPGWGPPWRSRRRRRRRLRPRSLRAAR